MLQPGFFGLCRDILLSFMPFIGGFAFLNLPLQPIRPENLRISSSAASLKKSDLLQPRPDYRPVKLFGKVVAINFNKGSHKQFRS